MSTSHPPSTGAPAASGRTSPMPKLLPEQRALLHRAASQWVIEAARRQQQSAPEQLLDTLADMTVHGIFVTLKRGVHLRGCCGVLGKPMKLGTATIQAATRTAHEDQRLAPISPSELPYLELDVTVLGPMEPIAASGADRADAVQPGKHGVAIQHGEASGLLLPSVATERNWNSTQFLQAVCRKANLPLDTWQSSSATVFTFVGQASSGPLAIEDSLRDALHVPHPMSEEELLAYVSMASANVAAIAQGATPTYYAPHLPDATVNAIVLSVQWGQEGNVQQGNAMQVSIRPGVPLQSTLFQMCETIAQKLMRQRYAGQFQLGLTIGIDPALHGAGTEVYCEGIETSRRGVVVNDARHCAIGFDPRKSSEELLQMLRSHLPVGSRFSMVHSLQFVSSLRDVVAVTVPAPVRANGTRDPAQAGKFYPAEDAARRSLVEGWFRGPEPAKRKALAVMVPHAGLRYSGRVAAEVWRGVEVPKTVIVISPKHTASGVNWAVCPFERWRLSSSVSFDGDPQLARSIVEQVPGMQFDAAAHEKEHGIEVQLPILERAAPTTRVVGITIHSGTWEEIEAAAEGLAAVIRPLEERPLLVISSDMNHFAPDAENRRLDRIALDALATGDPQTLLDTCRKHQISMCGVVPAALVMATLHKLGQAFRVEEVAYATSGDTGGDRSRVVGYAGTLFIAK